PPERDLEWSEQGVEGCYRFVNRVWRLVAGVADVVRGAPEPAPRGWHGVHREVRRVLHQTVRRVTEDIGQRFNFNTAISAIMELVNALYQYRERVPEVEQHPALWREAAEKLCLLLAPFAPHLAEELWELTGHRESVHLQAWPEYDPEALEEDEKLIVVQVNGRVRDRVLVPAALTGDALERHILEQPRVRAWLAGKEVRRVVTVPDKLVNIVVG
ncbi:MAG: class I tRNA ligase family protein, partial [Firmicutes bacterium]|nr:class I tRNA ligase family protein [Bacillota bacterium]